MSDMQLMWGWEPALYLFLGGLGAGTFVAASVLYLFTKQEKKKTLAAASWASIVFLGVGLLLLIIELEVPLRGLMLWQSFSHFTSWMTFGAWMAFAALVVFGITALLTTSKIYEFICKRFTFLPEKRNKIVRILTLVGAVLGLGVAVYTGLLLMSAPGVPLWNTWILPCLFTVSAIDTGIAAVVIILAITKEGSRATNKKLETAVLSLILVELVVLLVFVLTMLEGNPGAAILPSQDTGLTAQMQAGTYATMKTASTSILSLLTGSLAPAFWLVFVGLGLVAPLALALYGVYPKARNAHFAGLVGAVCALAGGCALRFLILIAGAHADFVGNAVAALVM